jgi:Holliday junction resolvase RusA-like endonuclease
MMLSKQGRIMKLIIDGEVPSQKNRKIISVNRATGRPFLRSAPAVKDWQALANIQLQKQFKGFVIKNYPISVSIIFYYGTLRRKDLDNSASSVMDALTAAQIIEDDNVNFVDCLQLQYGGHDKINPRVEIYLDD